MDEIKSLTKTKEFLDRPLFTGAVKWDASPAVGTFLAEYNKELKGWHYAWCGAKQQKEPHTFTAYMFVQCGPGLLRCIYIVQSSRFTIFSGRRKPKEDKGGGVSMKQEAPVLVKTEPAVANAGDKNGSFSSGFNNNSFYNGHHPQPPPNGSFDRAPDHNFYVAPPPNPSKISYQTGDPTNMTTDGEKNPSFRVPPSAPQTEYSRPSSIPSMPITANGSFSSLLEDDLNRSSQNLSRTNSEDSLLDWDENNSFCSNRGSLVGMNNEELDQLDKFLQEEATAVDDFASSSFADQSGHIVHGPRISGTQNSSMEFMNLALPSIDSTDLKRSSVSSLADLVRSSSFLTDANTPTLAVQQPISFESERSRVVYNYDTYGSSRSLTRGESTPSHESTLGGAQSSFSQSSAKMATSQDPSPADAAIAGIAKVVKEGIQHAHNASRLDIKRKYVLAICEYIWAIRKGREVTDALDLLISKSQKDEDVQSFLMIKNVVSAHSSKYSQRATTLLRHVQSTAQNGERSSEDLTEPSKSAEEDVVNPKKTESQKEEIKHALDALNQLVQSGGKKKRDQDSLSSLEWMSIRSDDSSRGESEPGSAETETEASYVVTNASDVGQKSEHLVNCRVVSRCSSDLGPTTVTEQDPDVRRVRSENSQPLVPDAIPVAQPIDSLFSCWVHLKDSGFGMLWKKRWVVLCPSVLIIHNTSGQRKREVGLEKIVEIQQIKKVHLKIKFRPAKSKKEELQFKIRSTAECEKMMSLLNENALHLKERLNDSKPTFVHSATPITYC